MATQEKTVIRYRVRKEEVQVRQFEKPDGLAICLECWKTWMLTDDRDLSAALMKLGTGAADEDGEHAGYESDPYEEQRRADIKIGEATGAMIDSLKSCHQWAIRKKMGISTVWHFRSVDFLSCLEDAQTELESKLRNHVATAMKFV